MHVLVSDDDEATRRVIRRMIESELGADVSECADGLATLAHLEHEPCDVLIQDLDLPLLSGRDVVRRARQMPAHRDLPILVLSHIDDESVVRELIALDVAGYILKPPTRAQVIEALRRVEHSRHTRASQQTDRRDLILIADGDAARRTAVAQYLRWHGPVVEAASGVDALVAFRSTPAHRILIGEKLGIVNGRRLADKLREWPQGPAVRLMQVSSAEPAPVAPPFDGALVLSRDREQLIAALREWLNTPAHAA